MTAHATLNGTITNTGGENCDERGFDWDIDSGEPYTNEWTETNSYGAEAFDHQVTGLPEGVTIYFRAKAHNSVGWGYGGELSFETPVTPPSLSRGWPHWAKRRRKIMIREKEEEVWDLITLMELID